MENTEEKSLSLEDKVKLKERLALLKKEYKRTVNRLQRSQRAERVKTHVKKTIEEQNRLLSQECAAQESGLVSAEAVNNTNNGSGDARESQRHTESTAEGDRKPSVTFSLEPDIVYPASRTPPSSVGDSSGQDAEGHRAHQSIPTSRSRLRLSRSARRVCFSESPSPSVFHIGNIVRVSDGQHDSSACKTPSPVFKKCSKDGATEKLDSSSTSYSPEDTKPGVTSPEIVGVSGAKLFRMGTADNSPGEAKCSSYNTQIGNCHSDAENTTTGDVLCECPDNVPKTMEEQPLLISKSQDLEETCNTTCDLSVTPTASIKLKMRGNLEAASTTSIPNPRITIDSPNHEVHGNNIEEKQNPLSSCTLVEGLLFPVEYYVRTTRRMTSCQRKVDLDAVIHSHLGTTRKGTRQRRNSISLSTPRHTLSSSLSPSGCPPDCNSTGKGSRARRGRGRRSCPAAPPSCPAAPPSALKNVSVQLEFSTDTSQTPSGSQSEKENCEVAASKEVPCNRLKGLTNIADDSHIKDAQKTGGRLMTLGVKVTRSSRSQDITSFFKRKSSHDASAKPSNSKSSTEVDDLTGSPLPVFGSRISLENLSTLQNITDFHLPDEEFGLLKLEKLKSTYPLEHFTPSPYASREERESSQCHKSDSATLPSPGSTVVLQGTANKTQKETSERDLILLEMKEHLNGDQPAEDLGQSFVTDTEQHSSNRLGTMCSNASEQTNAVLVTVSPETNLTPDSGVENHIRSIPGSPPVGTELSRSISQIPHISPCDWEAQVPTSASEVQGEQTLPAGIGGDLASGTNMEFGDATNSNVEPMTPIKPSSPKELSSSVLFSTSLCSVPLESMNDAMLPLCTPGFPCLGPTPAVLSPSPFSPSSLTHSPANGVQEVLNQEARGGGGLEFMILSSLDGGGVAVDTRQCTDVMEKVDSAITEDQGNCVQCEETTLQERSDCKDGTIQVTAERKGNEDETGHLLLVSEIQDSCAGECVVDFCSVWWEFSGMAELCIVSASNSSVCLWRAPVQGEWQCAHIWTFLELPVIQILPLSQEKNILCVALGNLEIEEIWALLLHPERLSLEKQLVTWGHMKTAQGLSRQRVVTSSRAGDGQVLEVWQLSEAGRKAESHTLVSPRDSVLAFCEVEGEKDALVGSTVDNFVAVWNVVTGHLLIVVYVGDHCSDLTCLSATSDSGLLFLVVGNLFSKPGEEEAGCVLKLIAANPRGGASSLIMSYIVPDKPSSRYLQGEVRRQRASAVLTCGSIALWDLPRSHCAVTLPPSSDAPWCLVRWGHSPTCLLTGRKDGTICIYDYTQSCPGPGKDVTVEKTYTGPCRNIQGFSIVNCEQDPAK
ncbi:partner and localizer of BRCA2 [Hyperolius riggenbachi]|uniref:partner and localizer of BRCA2 n=1 Tax=Hyperolius riggenbachi TaxID=752182 RepID=UPI0035A35353